MSCLNFPGLKQIFDYSILSFISGLRILFLKKKNTKMNLKMLLFINQEKRRKGNIIQDPNQDPFRGLEMVNQDTGMRAKDMYANVGHLSPKVYCFFFSFLFLSLQGDFT